MNPYTSYEVSLEVSQCHQRLCIVKAKRSFEPSWDTRESIAVAVDQTLFPLYDYTSYSMHQFSEHVNIERLLDTLDNPIVFIIIAGK